MFPNGFAMDNGCVGSKKTKDITLMPMLGGYTELLYEQIRTSQELPQYLVFKVSNIRGGHFYKVFELRRVSFHIPLILLCVKNQSRYCRGSAHTEHHRQEENLLGSACTRKKQVQFGGDSQVKD
jgi:hypothetical protein